MNGLVVAALMALVPGEVGGAGPPAPHIATITAFERTVFSRNSDRCALLGVAQRRYRDGAHRIDVGSHHRGLAPVDVSPFEGLVPPDGLMSHNAPGVPGTAVRETSLLFWLAGYPPGDAESRRMRNLTLLGTLRVSGTVQAFAPQGVWAHTLGRCDFDATDEGTLATFLEREDAESRVAHVAILQEWYALNRASRDPSHRSADGEVRAGYLTYVAEDCWRRRRPDCADFVGIVLAERAEVVPVDEP